jgi:hypothetical protein
VRGPAHETFIGQFIGSDKDEFEDGKAIVCRSNAGEKLAQFVKILISLVECGDGSRCNILIKLNVR